MVPFFAVCCVIWTAGCASTPHTSNTGYEREERGILGGLSKLFRIGRKDERAAMVLQPDESVVDPVQEQIDPAVPDNSDGVEVIHGPVILTEYGVPQCIREKEISREELERRLSLQSKADTAGATDEELGVLGTLVLRIRMVPQSGENGASFLGDMYPFLQVPVDAEECVRVLNRTRTD